MEGQQVFKNIYFEEYMGKTASIAHYSDCFCYILFAIE